MPPGAPHTTKRAELNLGNNELAPEGLGPMLARNTAEVALVPINVMDANITS